MQDIFSTIIRMSLQGTVIFMIIFFVRLLLKKLHILHKYMVGLWLILFFYLVIPWKLNLPVGFWNNEVIYNQYEYIFSADAAGNTKDDIYSGQGAVIESADAVEDSTNITTAIAIDNALMTDLWKIFSYIWLVVVIGLFGHLVYSYIVIKKRLLVCTPYKDNIYWAEEIHTPMVFGILFPKVFLPIYMEQENLLYAVAHEKMHIQRMDFLWKILAYMVCLIHWFNPFVWISYYLLGSDIEKACDEEVIIHLGEEKKKEYAYALLQVASGTRCKEKRIFVAPICFHEGDVKGRIKNIIKYKYTLPVVGTLVVICALVLAAIFMTSTNEMEDETKEESTTEPTENTDIIREEFEDILGYDGYYILDKSAYPPWFTYYYAVEGEESFLIATSWGIEQDDYVVDIDGDGIKELICNVMYGDGVQATIIYRRQGNQILQGFASDLLDEDSENIISMSLVTVYLPEENVVEISYYRMDLEQHLSKKYEIDFEKIKYWEEVVLTP